MEYVSHAEAYVATIASAAVMKKSFRGELGFKIPSHGGSTKVLEERTEEAELDVGCCVEMPTQVAVIIFIGRL